MVFSRYAGAGPLEWLLPAPRRAVLILELCFACDTSFADYKLSCWAACRPERRRNILQLAALSSLQVNCITSFFGCQVVFSASAASSLFRVVPPASAVVLLTVWSISRVVSIVNPFFKFFSSRPPPLLPLIMYKAGGSRGMGGCWPDSSKLSLLRQNVACCGCAPAI